MSGMLVLSIDRDLAGHLAVALQRHRAALNKIGGAEPSGLAELQEMALEIVKSDQQASQSATVAERVEDDLHERTFLRRNDIHRLTGASLATVDRWIRSGELPSCKRGRVRRIARADLDRFLTAT